MGIRQPFWRDSDYISALSDDDRHLGHAIQTDRWHAYDATKVNAAGDGFQYLGSFHTVDEAKVAVSRAIAISARPAVFRAGAQSQGGLN
jgi:hypothetical protein